MDHDDLGLLRETLEELASYNDETFDPLYESLMEVLLGEAASDLSPGWEDMVLSGPSDAGGPAVQ